uniref:Uncharacterized protein n=1 Tax=viral metagenome TaxID=1070528 RepID=A0A6C0HK62_9ZZZZ
MSNEVPESERTYPEKFPSLILDFTSALSLTFPEFKTLWSGYNAQTLETEWKTLYMHCLVVYPERFFDILYQNEEMFDPKNKYNLQFLPGVDFYRLYHCTGVTKKTRESMWKYIQLILFTIVGTLKDKAEFGDTMNLFEGIDETELQEKLASAMGNIGDFFKEGNDEMQNTFESFANTFTKNETDDTMEEMFEKMGSMFDTSSNEVPPQFDQNNMPDADNINDHLKGLFGGKLGSLAKELMEELSEDISESFGIDANSVNENADPKEVFKNLIRHPDKFLKIVQKINTKFQDKMKAGDLSQEDIMREAGDMLRKMKEMGGNSKEMKEMFQNMASAMGGGKNTRVDTNAIDRMMKMQSTKERLRSKLDKKKEANFVLESTKDPNRFVYKQLDGGVEAQQRSGIKPVTETTTNAELDELVAKIENTNNSKKSNKKKNKNKKK